MLIYRFTRVASNKFFSSLAEKLYKKRIFYMVKIRHNDIKVRYFEELILSEIKQKA